MHICTCRLKFGCYGISVISLIHWSAVPNFDQQTVLCNTKTESQGSKTYSSSSVRESKGNIQPKSGLMLLLPPWVKKSLASWSGSLPYNLEKLRNQCVAYCFCSLCAVQIWWFWIIEIMWREKNVPLWAAKKKKLYLNIRTCIVTSWNRTEFLWCESTSMSVVMTHYL